MDARERREVGKTCCGAAPDDTLCTIHDRVILHWGSLDSRPQTDGGIGKLEDGGSMRLSGNPTTCTRIRTSVEAQPTLPLGENTNLGSFDLGGKEEPFLTHGNRCGRCAGVREKARKRRTGPPLTSADGMEMEPEVRTGTLARWQRGGFRIEQLGWQRSPPSVS